MILEEKTEGICLQETPYLEKGRIFKVFTKEYGLISVMEKKAIPSLNPFCLGDWVIRKGRGEMYILTDGFSLDSFLHLRNSFESLMRAGQMAQDLLRSQLPGKSAPALYLLFLSYLKKLGNFSHPLILTTSFQLKLLLHDGLLLLQSQSPPSFNQKEWEIILSLCTTSTFSKLSEISVSLSLENKIRDFFFKSVA